MTELAPDLLTPDGDRPVHFIGIGGAGMAALAELFVRRGVAVSGCDQNPAGVVADLAELGVAVAAGHDPSHVVHARAVVYTSALAPDNAELAAARASGLTVVRRAEALGAAVNDGELVAIAGTAGKTTTTVMTTEALRAAGRRPTGVAGGRVGAWGGNMSWGGAPATPGRELYVVEADEYDRSFLALAPAVAVVTNIEADHLDIYRDLAEIREAFATFVAGARFVALCDDDPGARTLHVPDGAEIMRYGMHSSDARLVARDLRAVDGGSEFDVWFDGKMAGTVRIRVPGAHNVLNALAALAAGIGVGASVESMAPGLASFGGVERRFERIGDVRGVTIVDDYAHHPSKIAATVAAARSAFPGRRLVVAFQPHLYTRTRDFAADFGRVLAESDVLYLTEIYPAREQPVAGVDAGIVARAVERAGGRVRWRGSRGDLARALASGVTEGDVVLVLGAGDITMSARELLDLLRA